MAAGVHLIGGGWDSDVSAQIYGPFLAEAGTNAEIACVVIDEGDGADQFTRWASVLRTVAPCRPAPVLVPLGGSLDVADLSGADALLVCGGLTPAYAAALSPVAGALRDWLEQRPYCGFSAGACVASATAVTGGWLTGGRPLIPDDAAEDLEEVTLADGVALVPFVVDVHSGQWGTLPRLVAATGLAGTSGVAIDENTVVSVVDGKVSVGGAGHAHLAVAKPDGVLVTRFAAGGMPPIGDWLKGP